MRIPRSSSQNRVSEGECPGRWRTCSVRSRSSSKPPSVSGRVTCTADPQARKARETERSAAPTSGAIPWRSITSSAKESSASASSA